VVANFPFYIDADTNPGFTAATGTRVEYHEEIVDEDVWLANARARLQNHEAFGRDVVVVSDWAAALLDDRGWLARGDRVTWAQGMVGIAYSRDTARRDLTRVSELFEPDLAGRVALPNDARAAIGIALFADGVDPSQATTDEINETAGRLRNSMRLGQIVSFAGGRPIDKLLAGDVAAVVTRASDTVGIEATHPDVRFVVPEEGGLLLTDVAAVTASAAYPAGASSYIRYASDPDHAATRFRSVPAMWTIDGVSERLARSAPSVLSDPRRNPPADVRARLRSFRVLDEDEDATLRQVFAGVVGADR
jgi:spermidine/putrescine transport system substrate-binding protein